MSDAVPDVPVAPSVVIQVRKNGSLKVTGAVQIIDHEGRPIPFPTNKPAISLCRCGGSATKPFCDGAHKSNGFCDPLEPALSPA